MTGKKHKTVLSRLIEKIAIKHKEVVMMSQYDFKMEVGKRYKAVRDNEEIEVKCIGYDDVSAFAYDYPWIIAAKDQGYAVWNVDQYGRNIRLGLRIIAEIKPKRRLRGWVNVYEERMLGGIDQLLQTSHAYAKKEVADKYRNKNFFTIACLDLSKYNIEFEEGEGLDD